TNPSTWTCCVRPCTTPSSPNHDRAAVPGGRIVPPGWPERHSALGLPLPNPFSGDVTMASTAVSEQQHLRPSVAPVTYHHGDLKGVLGATPPRLIEERGASREVSLRGVAREIGVSHVATYRHFASKADLLSAVVDRWVTTL